jgi:hypothetical protein
MLFRHNYESKKFKKVISLFEMQADELMDEDFAAFKNTFNS